MKKLICKVIGHNWHEHPFTKRLQVAVPLCVCSRCGKSGWLL